VATAQANPPWVVLEDAAERLQDAERHGTDADKAAAREAFKAAQDRLGVVAAMMLSVAAGEFGPDVYTPRQETWSRLASRLGVDLLSSLIEDYRQLAQLAERRAARLQSLETRVRELEKRIDDLTPGVGADEWTDRQVTEMVRKVNDMGMRVRKLEKVK
jgi:hypothetical protein